ncbi:MAG: DUF3106 domain-containing protein [Proteobacteria bacterium]|nr:DUF3106 domain-containing protein [Pseudomonadota bacterium]
MMKGLAFAVFAPLLVAALSAVVMLLWNALIPSLFAGPVVTFWQAAGMLILCRLLFGGFRHHHGGHHHWRQRAWRSRWHGMSPDERERFRDGFRRWKHMSSEERREFGKKFGRPFGPCGPDMHGMDDRGLHDEPPGMHGERGGDEPKGA